MYSLRNYLFVCLLALFACSPSSVEDYRQEGISWSRSLILELQKIHNTEELLRSESFLKKKFDECVSLVIEACEYQQKHEEDVLKKRLELISDQDVNKDLKAELRRIYELEGGRECIERAQQAALVRLDAYERQLFKKKEFR